MLAAATIEGCNQRLWLALAHIHTNEKNLPVLRELASAIPFVPHLLG